MQKKQEKRRWKFSLRDSKKTVKRKLTLISLVYWSLKHVIFLSLLCLEPCKINIQLFIGLQTFLEECELRLHQDTCFPSAYKYQSSLNEKITQNVEILNATARELTRVSISESGMTLV